MKSPDEIKKALECCFYDSAQCGECPYYPVSCDRELVRDAREYIRQLEADKQQLEGMLTHMNQLRDAAAGRALKMEERVHQLEVDNSQLRNYIRLLQAERDAAVEDMHGRCPSCKHYDKDPKEEPCASCSSGYGNMDNWQWRGVQKEDSDA